MPKVNSLATTRASRSARQALSSVKHAVQVSGPGRAERRQRSRTVPDELVHAVVDEVPDVQRTDRDDLLRLLERFNAQQATHEKLCVQVA